jgi:hypothetical protein
MSQWPRREGAPRSPASPLLCSAPSVTPDAPRSWPRLPDYADFYFVSDHSCFGECGMSAEVRAARERPFRQESLRARDRPAPQPQRSGCACGRSASGKQGRHAATCPRCRSYRPEAAIGTREVPSFSSPSPPRRTSSAVGTREVPSFPSPPPAVSFPGDILACPDRPAPERSLPGRFLVGRAANQQGFQVLASEFSAKKKGTFLLLFGVKRLLYCPRVT